MSKVIKLMADYECFPLWNSDGEIGNVNPDDLPLTLELRSALHAWANVYDKTLNWEDPRNSGFASTAEEEAFDAEGRRLWRAMQNQLGSDYRVVYFCNRDASLNE